MTLLQYEQVTTFVSEFTVYSSIKQSFEVFGLQEVWTKLDHSQESYFCKKVNFVRGQVNTSVSL